MQKFDDEPSMEFKKNINRAYDSLRSNHNDNLLKKLRDCRQVFLLSMHVCVV